MKLVPGSGTLGQQYVTPQQAIVEKGSDIIIVGRDIYEVKVLEKGVNDIKRRRISTIRKL